MATSTISRYKNNDIQINTGCVLEEFGGLVVIQFNGYQAVDGVSLIGGRFRPSKNVFNVMTDESSKISLRVGISTSGLLYLRSITAGSTVDSALLTGQIVYRITAG